MKRFLSLMLTLFFCIVLFSGCSKAESSGKQEEVDEWLDAVCIELADEEVKVDGRTASEDSAAAVYTANNIIYYEDGKDFTYGEGTQADAHSVEEAAAHTVVHITRPGSYVLSGTLSAGQIAVDLGDNAEEDPNAVVTLILDGVDITCTVAPAVIFYNVYECGSTDTETATKDVDTSAAGANVLIADGSVNTVNGSYVACIYTPESVVLSEDGTEVENAKKLHKYDAAFYSRMSMNVDGETSGASNMNAGVLFIFAENEGLDSELHLTINGGIIDIRSGNDGINTNEDNVSVTAVNGGYLNITVTGETGEGDGIDSNGWLVINGGTVVAAACSNSMDSGIDSDMGIHINGGTVIASGHMLDRIEDGGQNYMVFNFADRQAGSTEYTLKPEDGHMLATYYPVNDYSILLISDTSLTVGNYTLWQGDSAVDGIQMAHGGVGEFGPGMGGGHLETFGGQMPDFEPLEGFKPGKPPEEFMPPEGFNPEQLPEGMTLLEGFDPDGIPEGMSRPGGFRGNQSGNEISSVFTLTDGGSLFSNVMPASEAESVILGEGTEIYSVIIGETEEQSSNGRQS